MAHVALPPEFAGISGPLRAYPETGNILSLLAQQLLRDTVSVAPAEREMIASYVSARNKTQYCHLSHGAAARALLGPDAAVVDAVLADPETAPISDKLRALLAIAARVQEGGRSVTEAHVARARAAGADDKAIHDTVLIAAAFCMYNRYVDGLDTPMTDDPAFYADMGAHLAQSGYIRTT